MRTGPGEHRAPFHGSQQGEARQWCALVVQRRQIVLTQPFVDDALLDLHVRRLQHLFLPVQRSLGQDQLQWLFAVEPDEYRPQCSVARHHPLPGLAKRRWIEIVFESHDVLREVAGASLQLRVVEHAQLVSGRRIDILQLAELRLPTIDVVLGERAQREVRRCRPAQPLAAAMRHDPLQRALEAGRQRVHILARESQSAGVDMEDQLSIRHTTVEHQQRIEVAPAIDVMAGEFRCAGEVVACAQLLVELAQIIEQDFRPCLQTGSLEESKPEMRHPATRLLHMADEVGQRVPVASSHMQTQRIQRGEPAQAVAQIGAGSQFFVAAMRFQEHILLGDSAPLVQRDRQCGQEQIVDPGTVRAIAILQQRTGRVGAQRRGHGHTVGKRFAPGCGAYPCAVGRHRRRAGRRWRRQLLPGGDLLRPLLVARARWRQQQRFGAHVLCERQFQVIEKNPPTDTIDDEVMEHHQQATVDCLLGIEQEHGEQRAALQADAVLAYLGGLRDVARTAFRIGFIESQHGQRRLRIDRFRFLEPYRCGRTVGAIHAQAQYVVPGIQCVQELREETRIGGRRYMQQQRLQVTVVEALAHGQETSLDRQWTQRAAAGTCILLAGIADGCIQGGGDTLHGPGIEELA
ncbi:hypothetical protein NB696_003939 [Xanthomonas sacchari]|nr:hypothetical protein [Xanthomonas sacchari]MCW0447067.1 hypothetical protein [Xanthomonas sacchari]MCW0464405.1 hypothetical protein [Xanthomonas sacchari]